MQQPCEVGWAEKEYLPCPQSPGELCGSVGCECPSLCCYTDSCLCDQVASSPSAAWFDLCLDILTLTCISTVFTSSLTRVTKEVDATSEEAQLFLKKQEQKVAGSTSHPTVSG